jgi:hypothetical protein
MMSTKNFKVHPKRLVTRGQNVSENRNEKHSRARWHGVGGDYRLASPTGEFRLAASMITSKAATNDHLKTGHHEVTETGCV